MLASRFSLISITYCLLLTIAPVYAEHLPVVVPDSIPGVKILTTESLVSLAQTEENLIVIDSRIADDRALGYIGESISLPDLETNCTTLKHIASDLTQPLVFYCNSTKCNHSFNAVKKAISCDYQYLYWLRGGFREWKAKDYPYMLE